ncbi:MAG: hypothetical protein KKF74_00900 [Nanoarchaeota archaeon]|nr:hypothetical protein [Nanoarchaeota archaeon]
MPMYIPHAKYPKSHKEFNVIKMNPGLFSKIDLKDFTITLSSRVIDFFASQTFLYSSKFQENYGSKLVMLLSAVERSNGQWTSLESILKSQKFRSAIKLCATGEKAFSLIDETVEEYLDNFGSIRSVVNFYTKNLTFLEKKLFISGVLYLQTYKRKKIKDGLMLTPVSVQDPKEFEKDDEKRINYKLSKRLKEVIYSIRNYFVHNAEYIPYPDQKYIDGRKYFRFTTYKNGLPYKDWLIGLPFEQFYKITNKAFERFWLREYEKSKRKTSTD